ncbi:hypothetical protein H4R26_001702 [Coemansia thaxteri]|uniref:Actin-related protein n=1 Tax=Coemansia thaxteri TaxID=2663907 RepID=A0A9W8BME7_9FUNG|nr:hypothetical protein H4R26_001702 [Coemansia thaxteri]KAJ2483061.1 hypothetical protein EV174_003043 [Coemansia sp. RSA 2320]
MAISHREENFVVIELGSHTTKAMMDTTDINRLPSVAIRTRAGILKPDSSAPSQNDNAEEEEPTPLPEKNEMQVDGASEHGEKEEATGTKAEDESKASSIAALDEGSDTSYVFGSALEVADESALSQTFDIISEKFVKDWDALSAFLRHILTKELGIRISSNISPILFSVPPLWPKTDLECLTQIAFEHLNAPCILIVEQPLLAVYGNGAVTGLVVDFGHSATTVTAIVDSAVQSSCIAQSDIAGAAVTARLHQLLQEEDSGLCAQFGSEGVPLEFAVALKESGLCKFQLLGGDAASPVNGDDGSGGEGGRDNIAQPRLVFQGKSYEVSADVLSKAVQSLIAPVQVESVPVANLMKQVVLGCETEKRAALWESIHLVGGSSQFSGLKDSLQLELEGTVLPSSNIFSSSQTREIRFASLPEYFVGWRGRDHWAAFLGACIVAKIALNDSKHNISRSEYNESGPTIVHTKSF